MRLRRVLGVLLAALLLAGFALPGAAAAGEAQVLQTGGWQQAEFRWAGEADEVSWQVYRVEDGALTPVPLHESFAAQLAQDGLFVLSLRAAEPLFGRFKVTITADGETGTAGYVWLLCDSELQTVIAQARQVAQNPNGRYCDAYIARLQAAIAAAQALYAADDVIPGDMAAQVRQLQFLVAAPELSMTGNGLFNRFIPGWWRVVDAVAAPFRRTQSRTEIILPIIGQVFTAMFSF